VEVVTFADIQKVKSSFEFKNSISSTRNCNEFRFFEPRFTSLSRTTFRGLRFPSAEAVMDQPSIQCLIAHLLFVHRVCEEVCENLMSSCLLHHCVTTALLLLHSLLVNYYHIVYTWIENGDLMQVQNCWQLLCICKVIQITRTSCKEFDVAQQFLWLVKDWLWPAKPGAFFC